MSESRIEKWLDEWLEKNDVRWPTAVDTDLDLPALLAAFERDHLKQVTINDIEGYPEEREFRR